MKATRLLAIMALVAAVAWPVLAEEEMCGMCHDDVAAAMANQIHMRIKPFEVGGHAVGCQGCHGDGTKHMEEEGDPAFIRTFADRTAEDAEACLECHQIKDQNEWHASVHAAEGLTCFDCHTIHTATNPRESCRTCHADVSSQMQLPSHHPVREGKMSCVSCHDPHAATESQLRTQGRVNDLCYTCHQDKEGPFIFEHEPVEENCLLCHDPHGTVANNLLTANEPMLCLQCHELHFHAGLVSPEGPVEVGGTERENPFGTHSMNVAFTTRCTQCHPKVHGSDLPSQTVPGRGRGLTR